MAGCRGRTTDVDVGYSDLGDLIRRSEIPKDLFAFMGYFEARNGRFSVFSDLVYLKIGLFRPRMASSTSSTRSRPVHFRPCRPRADRSSEKIAMTAPVTQQG
jgi:hypothetical protein